MSTERKWKEVRHSDVTEVFPSCWYIVKQHVQRPLHFPISHTLIPALNALCNVCRPQLPTINNCRPPNSLACSSWKRLRNLKFTFGPSIETDTRFHSIQYVFRPWVSHELWAKVVRLNLSILLESQVQIHLFGFCSHIQTFVEHHHKFFCSTHRGHELLLEI